MKITHSTIRCFRIIAICFFLIGTLTLALQEIYYRIFFYNSYGVSQRETKPDYESSPAFQVGNYDFETILYRDKDFNSVTIQHLRKHINSPQQSEADSVGYTTWLSASSPIRLIKNSIKIEHRLEKNGPALKPLKIENEVDENNPRNNYFMTYKKMPLPNTLYETVSFDMKIQAKIQRVEKTYTLHLKPYYNTLGAFAGH